jgi:hypothetical protein
MEENTKTYAGGPKFGRKIIFEEKVLTNCALKGQSNRIFCLLIFFRNGFPLTPLLTI